MRIAQLLVLLLLPVLCLLLPTLAWAGGGGGGGGGGGNPGVPGGVAADAPLWISVTVAFASVALHRVRGFWR